MQYSKSGAQMLCRWSIAKQTSKLHANYDDSTAYHISYSWSTERVQKIQAKQTSRITFPIHPNGVDMIL